MYLDINVIENVPPSNINRDDAGNPKTAVYGGTMRARVSSQAWKRAMRAEFSKILPGELIGSRTKRAVKLITTVIDTRAQETQNNELSLAAEQLAVAVLQAAGLKVVDSGRAGNALGSKVTEYLIFIATSEINQLADIAIRWFDEHEDIDNPSPDMKKEVKNVFHGNQAVDIALFGRMLADAPQLNVDASAQVAHAISVDTVAQDYDYFTAVDDEEDQDNAGAAMIDTVGFNSSTLYRYATVNVDAFEKQLGDAVVTAEGLTAFVDAFIRSMPTGKSNTFANHTLPSTVIVSLRERQAFNAVNAFENPVHAIEDKSISEVAADRLGKKIAEIEKAYDSAALKSWNVVVGTPIDSINEISEPVTLSELKQQLKEFVIASLENKE